MSVTPSPIGGFAAQFFDNNGVILSGGKIYTYAAGTTTPQATYTSAAGVTPHANPIVLDSAGRVPGGEIWLTDGLVYKFVIETSTSILIGSYDNITGVNSNFINYTVQEEVQTATAGQTVFTLTTINYTPGTNSLSVYIDGVNQYVGDSYLETDSTTVTFTSGLHVGAEVKFTTAVQTTTGAVDASIVSYDPPFTNSVATTVEDKLAQYVSVKDFGAVGDGVTDDTAAIQAAVAAASGKVLDIPAGQTFLVNALTLTDGIEINGGGTLKFASGGLTIGNNNTLRNITIDGNNKANAAAAVAGATKTNLVVDGVTFNQIGRSAITLSSVSPVSITNCQAYEIGDPGIINVTSEGMFAYMLGCTKVFICNNPKIERTYGHAAIFVGTNCTDVSVCDNAIYDTFFRGIQVFSTNVTRILIADNRIYRMGEINTTGSGVTCNGVYVVTNSTDPARVLIANNHIEDVAENGIETLGPSMVIGNVIKRTGYRSLTTPSKEGIFPSAGTIVKSNLIIDAVEEGIRNYTSGARSSIEVSENVIINSGGDGIAFQADTATGAYTNCHIKNNVILSYSGSWAINFNGTAGGVVDGTNTVSGNIVPSSGAVVIATAVKSFSNSWQSTLKGTSTVNPASLGAGATQQFTVTVTGAATTNTGRATFSQKNADIYWVADVTATDTVTVTQVNRGVGAIDLASGTLTVYVDRD